MIGAGCGRTGTSSLREALKTLGYNPYHMEECVRNDHFRLWLRAGRGDGAALDAALREGQRRRIFLPRPSSTSSFVGTPPRRSSCRRATRATGRGRSGRQFGTRTSSRSTGSFVCCSENARRTCVACTASASSAAPSRRSATSTRWRVRAAARRPATVPADRLLVHRATDGWAPLCAFLGKPIPDAPYELASTTLRLSKALPHLPAGVPGRVLRQGDVAGGYVAAGRLQPELG